MHTKLMPFPAVSEAVDLMALTSRAAELFLKQDRGEQRKLLHLVLQEASWKGGELRMCFREPCKLYKRHGIKRRWTEF
jgi:hypothetical protein